MVKLVTLYLGEQTHEATLAHRLLIWSTCNAVLATHGVLAAWQHQGAGAVGGGMLAMLHWPWRLQY